MKPFLRQLTKMSLALVTVALIAACGSVLPEVSEDEAPSEALQIDAKKIQEHFVFTEDGLLALGEDAAESLTAFEYEFALSNLEFSNHVVSTGQARYGDVPSGVVHNVQADDLETLGACRSYISYTYWRNRGGSHPWALSIIPEYCARSWGRFSYTDAWNELLRESSTRNVYGRVVWDQTDWQSNISMHHQFVCHVFYAIHRGTWNLEPTRPYVGWQETVDYRCNPG